MKSCQKTGAVELDRAKLLGFDLAPDRPQPAAILLAKVGEKPSGLTKDAGLAGLTKVGFKENLGR